MEISIVTGTFNRLQHLKRMIGSVRASVGPTVPYEIVIVDGGSTDGTISWCLQQFDVVLVQQGELLGAIKAFNAGFQAAQGRYVIAANDDIEFIGFSILYAYSYMQDHPQVGVGCFMQDRNGKAMHVETMPAVIDGKPSSTVYGQVCIVPRELGNKVGWWGDFGAKTYGGDNELSCNILELGYKAVPLECSCIHDFQVDDMLRTSNAGYPQEMFKRGKPHPDSVAWRNKWTHPNGTVGPIIDTKTVRRLPVALERYFRIYYAPIYELDHKKQHLQKKTLLRSLQQRGSVFECDYQQESVDYMLDSVYTFKPDLLLLQAQDAGKKFNMNTVLEIREMCPKAQLVMWNGDYHPKNLTNPDYINMLKLFDLCGFATLKFKEMYDTAGLNWMYLQAGFEDYPEADEPVIGDKWDFVFLGNGYSDFRKKLARTIMSTNYSIGLYGMWPKNFHSQGDTLYDYRKNYKIYNSAKFAISDQQWPDSTGYVSDRIFHSMRSGIVVLQQYFDGMEDMMGLVDGENLFVWKDFQDLYRLMVWCMSNLTESDRLRIGTNGQRHVAENYHYDNFVDRMLEALGYE